MGEKLTEKSALRPWLDKVEEDTKFRKGIIGVTSDRWTAIPKLEPCWKGDYREWRIEEDGHQNQCWCRYWKKPINPSGFNCYLCTKRAWPTSESYRTHILPTLDKKLQAEAILEAVQTGQLSEADALHLGKEVGLSD